MKRIYLFCLALILVTTLIEAQDTPVCDPDTAFVNSGEIVSPSPIQNDTLGEGLPNACINTPYDLNIFVHPPSTFTFAGFEIPVTSFKIDSVINLPEGINYGCSTEDCIFLADSINCIYLSGTPTEANTESQYELTIYLTVIAGNLPLAATFPDPTLAPGSYFIIINPEGDAACQSTPTLDFNAIAESVRVFPNPVYDRLSLSFESKKPAEGLLQVWNHAGALVKQKPVTISTGKELLSIELENLPQGFYVVGLQTKEATFRSKFIKS
jgi:hypothetical protein